MASKASNNNPFLEAALGYARAGIRIFPMKPRSKEPQIKDNLNRATTNEAQIRQWWKWWPNANIGMPTGTRNNRFVIDPDGPVGEETLGKLVAENGQLPDTFTVRTGRAEGGWHLHFRVDGVMTKSAAGLLGPKLDVKGDGGFVLLPPSIHPDTGKEYTVHHNGQPAEAPQWLVAKVRKDTAGSKRKTTDKVKLSDTYPIPFGEHYDTLVRYAGLMLAKGMPEREIGHRLTKMCEKRCVGYLTEGDRDYRKMCADIATRVSETYADSDDRANDPAPGRQPITDISNAERLVARFSEDVRYASDRRIWCAWDATHWAANDPMGVSRRMQEVARGIYLEASKEPNPALRNALAEWAQRSESQSVQMSSIDAARCHVEVKRFGDVFDTDPLALNGPKGTADLKKRESVNAAYPRFYPHRREDYITKVAPVEYRSEAKCPQFDSFLNQTFRESAALIRYAQLFTGYCLTGLTTEQKWWMFYGPTASGKSTFIKILHGILGPYALPLPENYFLLSKHESTDFVTANLVGVRLATCIETNEGRRLNVARIKTITGEDSISAALKHQNYFEFKPQCKLVLVTNYPPHVPAGDDALWRRLKVVPFVATVPEDKRIPGLADKLLAEERSGILNWAITGCRDWQTEGLKEPPEVTAAISEYRTSEDLIANFLADKHYEQDPDGRSAAQDVFKEFRDWCMENSIRPGTKTRFTRELRRLGFPLDDGGRHYTGISHIAHI
jgi:putative DNA primase/helicase